MKKVLIYIVMMSLSVVMMSYFVIESSSMFVNPVIIVSLPIVIGILVIVTIKVLPKLTGVNYKDYISLEQIPIEFENIYEKLYINHIEYLETMRKKIVWRTVIQFVLYILVLVVYIFVNPRFIPGLVRIGIYWITIQFAFIFIAVIFTYLNSINKKNYIEFYKKEIISRFVKLINNQLEYQPADNEILRTEEDYKKAKFDNRTFNRFYPDDYIEGFLDDVTYIKMCDLHIKNHIKVGKYSTTEEIFQGIFAHTKCDKDIGTYIKITENKTKLIQQEDKIEMDSHKFEEYFDVHSENRVIAMQLLTSDTMETLVDFYNKYGLSYEIVFRNNTIYFRFFTGAMFEPKIFGSSMDKQLLFMYYSILKFIVDIISKINNTLKEIEI